MKKILLFSAALMFGLVACQEKENASGNNPGNNEGGGEEQPPVLKFEDYVTAEDVTFYDDQWLPSSETITITASKAGECTADFACTEEPFDGRYCIKWAVHPNNKTERIDLVFDKSIDLSSYEAKGYCLEFAVKSNWWIGGNDFCVLFRDSAENADGKPWEYRQNAIHMFDENTPVTTETPDGTMAPGVWYRVSIPLAEIWGATTEIDGTSVDWSGKTLKNSSGNEWLPDLKALNKFSIVRWGGTQNPNEEQTIIWFDEIRLCKASFTPNK